MPWKETDVLRERRRFIQEAMAREWTMDEICRAFGISRKTGYKYIKRFEEQGIEGLRDRSSAPHRHPNQTTPAVIEMLLKARKKHPRWGPRKLIAWLKEKPSKIDLPALSTVGEILKRNGMVKARKRRRRSTVSNTPFSHALSPNDVWCLDFKGWFRTGDGQRCDPLTVTDAFSRFGLVCNAVAKPRHDLVRPVMKRAFREYGLPSAMRSDNGSPFASTGLAGLSKLAVWWIKLGIRVERIEPGKPQQNGRHERFHLTLKQETASPPKRTHRGQQVAFTKFLREYNYERPHEALEDKTPAKYYKPSSRVYPARLGEMEYPAQYEVRRVRHDGTIKWRGDYLYVCEPLIGELVGLEQTTTWEHLWKLYFGPLELGLFDEKKKKVLRNQVLHYRSTSHDQDGHNMLQCVTTTPQGVVLEEEEISIGSGQQAKVACPNSNKVSPRCPV